MIYSGLSEPVIYPVDFYIPKITQDVAVSDSILVYPSSTLLNQERIHSSWMIMISRYQVYHQQSCSSHSCGKKWPELATKLEKLFQCPIDDHRCPIHLSHMFRFFYMSMIVTSKDHSVARKRPTTDHRPPWLSSRFKPRSNGAARSTNSWQCWVSGKRS